MATEAFEPLKQIVLERTTLNKIVSPLIIVFATFTYFNQHWNYNQYKILPASPEIIIKSIFQNPEMKFATTASILPGLIDLGAGKLGLVYPQAGLIAGTFNLSVELIKSFNQGSVQDFETLIKNLDLKTLYYILFGILFRQILEFNTKYVKKQQIEKMLVTLHTTRSKQEMRQLLENLIYDFNEFKKENQTILINPKLRRLDLLISILNKKLETN